jgi:hypothetical protein
VAGRGRALRPPLSTGPRTEAYSALAARVATGRARLGPTRLVAVDGRGGAGKTTFAGRLAAEEDRFFSADPVWERAALVVDGAPGLPHDPETEYVRLR